MSKNDDEVIGGPLPDLRKHMENQLLGMIQEDSIHSILPTEPMINVLVLDQFGFRKMLVTEGMSTAPLEGDPDYRWAGLVLALPGDWPVDSETLDNPARFWPVEWIRRLAYLPDQRGGGYGLFTVFDYEEPLGEGCRFSGFLIIAMPGEAGSFVRSDGERVVLYNLLPLYPEELALVENEGIRALLMRLDQRKDAQQVTIDRPSLV